MCERTIKEENKKIEIKRRKEGIDKVKGWKR